MHEEMQSGEVHSNGFDGGRRQDHRGFQGFLVLVSSQPCCLFCFLDGIGGFSQLFTSPFVNFGLPVCPERYI